MHQLHGIRRVLKRGCDEDCGVRSEVGEIFRPPVRVRSRFFTSESSNLEYGHPAKQLRFLDGVNQ